MESVGRLDKVVIRGYRSIASAEVNFGEVTVLVGANGAGKSALIGFLEMLSQMMSRNLQGYVGRALGGERLLHYGRARTRSINAICSFLYEDKSSAYEFELVPISGDRLGLSGEAVLSWSSEDEFVESHVLGGKRFESEIPELLLFDDDLENNPKLASLVKRLSDQLRSFSPFHFQDTSSISRIRGLQRLQDDQALHPTGDNLAVMLARLAREHPKSFSRVESEVRSVCPEFRNFLLQEASDRPREIELRWKGYDPVYVFGPDQFSDGTLRAIALITLTQLPDDWLPSIVVIDEPELGLHPFAVGQVARLLSELSVRRQVIVATQSSIFVSNFEVEDIVVVRQEMGASVFERLDAEALASWLEAFDGDLGKLFEMDVLGSGPR